MCFADQVSIIAVGILNRFESKKKSQKFCKKQVASERDQVGKVHVFSRFLCCVDG